LWLATNGRHKLRSRWCLSRRQDHCAADPPVWGHAHPPGTAGSAAWWGMSAGPRRQPGPVGQDRLVELLGQAGGVDQVRQLVHAAYARRGASADRALRFYRPRSTCLELAV